MHLIYVFHLNLIQSFEIFVNFKLQTHFHKTVDCCRYKYMWIFFVHKHKFRRKKTKKVSRLIFSKHSVASLPRRQFLWKKILKMDDNFIEKRKSSTPFCVRVLCVLKTYIQQKYLLHHLTSDSIILIYLGYRSI